MPEQIGQNLFDKLEVLNVATVGRYLFGRDHAFFELSVSNRFINKALSCETFLSLYPRSREVMLAVVRQNGLALQYGTETLRADQVVVMAAVYQNGLALQYAAETGWVERNDGSAWHYMTETLKADPGVVLAAVRQNGCAFQYADERLKADPEVVLAAVLLNDCALQYTSEKSRVDLGFVGALKDAGVSSRQLSDAGFGIVPSYSGALTVTGMAGVSLGGIGLSLIHTGIISGIVAPYLWWLSIGITALGGAMFLYAGVYHTRQRLSPLRQPYLLNAQHFWLKGNFGDDSELAWVVGMIHESSRLYDKGPTLT